MKKKKIIILIIVLVAVAAGGYFYSFVKRDCALYDTDYSRSQMIPAVDIYEGSDFQYSFHCDKDNLTGVKVIASAINSEKAKGTITYSLLDKNGDKVTGPETMKLSRFKNGKFTFLSFDTIKDSKDKDYTFVISCDGDKDNGARLAVQPDNGEVALSYTYTVWDLQTMIIFVVFTAYLVAFMSVLLKIFRK